jgi:hypothetical protein
MRKPILIATLITLTFAVIAARAHANDDSVTVQVCQITMHVPTNLKRNRREGIDGAVKMNSLGLKRLFPGTMAAVGPFAHPPSGAKAPAVIPFIEATGNNAVLGRRRLFKFSIGDYRYTIDGIGRLTVKSPDKKTITLVLDFPDPPLVTNIRYCFYQSDLLINYDFLSNALIERGNKLVKGKVPQGRISRLNARTLKTKWTIINAYSDPPGVPIVADQSIYTSSAGFIGEIDLADGSYLWRHEDLRAPGERLFEFKVPRVTDDYVFFEEKYPRLNRPAYTVQVLRHTGEIITMNYKPSK